MRTASKKTFATLAAAMVVSGVASYVVIDSERAAADTESCVTKAEYDQTDVFMSPARIEQIYDVNGVFGNTASPDTFARIYHSLCWTNSEAIRIVFDQDSGLSIRWRLIAE